MGIGGSIFLIAVGAIIAFAVDVSVGWLDLQVVGWVLMLAGVIGLILTLDDLEPSPHRQQRVQRRAPGRHHPHGHHVRRAGGPPLLRFTQLQVAPPRCAAGPPACVLRPRWPARGGCR